jgi:N-acetylglucosaminyldiphosphoundecaprenol N-acetyl-beta-D-mannosaminyltransferase
MQSKIKDIFIKDIDFCGLRISDFYLSDLDSYFRDIISSQNTIICYGYSFGIIPFFKKYKDLYGIINSFDINVTDGTQFYWFMKLLGYKLKTFLSIPFLTIKTLEFANINKKSVFLLGADTKTNINATENLKNKYPDIYFLEGRDGYFSETEEYEVVNYIKNKKPNILLIGISSPKKERFAYKYKNELNTNIIIPCGGMIDVFAGKVKLASPFLKKIGLATLIRIIQEPRRQLKLNIRLAYETFIKIIPKTIYEVKLKKNKNFAIPSIYGIKE